MRVKSPRDGYVRCETLMPIIGCQILPIPEMPTRRVLGLLTDDGALCLGVTAESAQVTAEFLARERRRPWFSSVSVLCPITIGAVTRALKERKIPLPDTRCVSLAAACAVQVSKYS
jgi:hypothetical protein